MSLAFLFIKFTIYHSSVIKLQNYDEIITKEITQLFGLDISFEYSTGTVRLNVPSLLLTVPILEPSNEMLTFAGAFFESLSFTVPENSQII